MTAVISLTDVEYRIHDKLSVRIDRFELHAGQFHVLLGANGAGKSTLFGIISGQQKPDRGNVTLVGQPLSSFSSKQQAQRRAVLSQEQGSVFQFSVEEIVAMGRYPWAGTDHERNDLEVIRDTVQKFELADLVSRPLDVLSGGEKARVAMGRITAQATPVILLDEPTAALDLKHQISLLRSVKAFTEHGGSALVIVHDINRALEFADKVSFMHGGNILVSGTPEQVVTAEIIEKTYGLPVDVRVHPVTGRLNVTPLM